MCKSGQRAVPRRAGNSAISVAKSLRPGAAAVLRGLTLCLCCWGSAWAAGERQSYLLHCSGCHQADGRGAPHAGVPDMRGTLGHFTRVPEGRSFLVQVPGTSNSPLDHGQTAAMLNWMLKTFSPEAIPADFRPYQAQEVAQLRSKGLDDVAGMRSSVVEQLNQLGWPVK